MSTLEYLYDKGNELCAQELCDHYQHDLPLLVVVSRGFYGNREEMSFSAGQVLRVHEVRQQQRALVHDDRKKSLSIPLDYCHRFFVGNDRTQALTIGEIIEQQSLPVKVKFAESSIRFDAGPDHPKYSLSALKIIKQHEETYLVANTVMQGTSGELLDTVIPIPMYLKDVRFCLVTGVKGRGITDGGRSHIDALLHPPSTFYDCFSQDHGDKELVQLSEKPIKATDNIYQNINTNIYINVTQLRQRQQPRTSSLYEQQPFVYQQHHQQQQQHQYQQDQKQSRRRPPTPPSEEYEKTDMVGVDTKNEYTNLRTLRRDAGSLSSPHDASSAVDNDAFRDDLNVYEPIGDMDKKTSIKPKPQTQNKPVSTEHTTTPSIMTTELQRKIAEREARLAASTISSDNLVPEKAPKKGHKTESPDRPRGWRSRLKPVQKLSVEKEEPTLSVVQKTSASEKEDQALSVVKKTSAAEKDSPTPRVVHKTSSSTEKELSTPTPSPKPEVSTKPVVTTKPILANKPGLKPKPGTTQTDSTQPITQRKPAEKQPTKLKTEEDSRPPKKIGNQESGLRDTKSSQASKDSMHISKDSSLETLASKPLRPQFSELALPPKQMSKSKDPISPGVSDECGSGDATYINQTQMAVIAPVTRNEVLGQVVKVDEGRDKSHARQDSKSSMQVPKDTSPTRAILPTSSTTTTTPSLPTKSLDEWTREEVQQLLVRLNLSRYSEQFEENMVDGNTLRQFTDDIYAEFGFTALEKMRLNNFVKSGRLPR